MVTYLLINPYTCTCRALYGKPVTIGHHSKKQGVNNDEHDDSRP